MNPDVAVLSTPRLLLREWREDDKPHLERMNRDPLVMRYFPGLMPRPESDAMADDLREQHERLGYTLWVVEVRESEHGATSFAGFAGLSEPSWQAPFAHRDPLIETGWRLRPQWWGLGIATEAARAAIAYGFDVAGLPEIVSFCIPANTRSRAVMERVGMWPDGTFNHPRATPSDPWRRHLLYRMRPDDPRT